VVLTPRRWRQACGINSAGDGDNKARSPGRARRKPLKPLRAGMPGESGEPVVTMLVCFLLFACEAAGASSARHSPRPRSLQGEMIMHHSGADAPRECEGVFVLRAGSRTQATVSLIPPPRGTLVGSRRAKLALGKADRERSERCAGWGAASANMVFAQRHPLPTPPDWPSASHPRASFARLDHKERGGRDK
jgi:hypothetical protein